MDGFLFAPSLVRGSTKSLPTIPECHECGLFKHCTSPKMPARGAGRRKILIVGEQPGKTEDQTGKAFTGQSGQLLADTLRDCGVDLAIDCISTNAVICYDGGKREVKNVISKCRANVFNLIKQHDPHVILLLGGAAVESVIGQLWKAGTGGITRWVGWQIPHHKPNVWICPTYNPAFILRSAKTDEVALSDFRRHIKSAVSLVGRPWVGSPPDYQSMVTVEHDTTKAARRIDACTSGLVAFDYETTCLRPEAPGARIVCCSVCFDGEETIAFPWDSRTKRAMRDLYLNPEVRKIASNMKFEDRWTRVHVGVEIAGWHWDTMLAAHAIEPRADVSSIKFQSFVLLGAGSYNDHIEPYLAATEDGCNAINRIHQTDSHQLLTYCGLDSLLEYKVAIKQMELIGEHANARLT